MTFKFKVPRPPAQIKASTPAPATHNLQEKLTGFVQGKRASTLEERFARSLDKLGVDYVFQSSILPDQTLAAGQQLRSPGVTQIDFLILRGGVPSQPVQIDGEIAHYHMKNQQLIDQEKTAMIDEAMKPYGALPTVRIPYQNLTTPDLADQAAKEVVL